MKKIIIQNLVLLLAVSLQGAVKEQFSYMSEIEGETIMITITRSGEGNHGVVSNYSKKSRKTFEVYDEEFQRLSEKINLIKLDDYDATKGGNQLNTDKNHIIGYGKTTEDGKTKKILIVPKSYKSEELEAWISEILKYIED